MTKLEKIYASIKGLQDLGLPLNTETSKAPDDLEEQLIKEEIIESELGNWNHLKQFQSKQSNNATHIG